MSWNKKTIDKLVELRLDGQTWNEISSEMYKLYKLDVSANNCRKCFYRTVRDNVKPSKVDVPVKVLLLDIETAPIVANVWGLFDQNVGLNQIIHDTSVLSWSAKWLGSDQVLYQDNRNSKDVRDDKELLMGIWQLIDEADILLFQNGVSFDRKVLNSRFIQNGMKPPSSCRYIDTMRIAKKHFKFTSNKLEFLTGILCTEHRKSSHGKFPGFKLWEQCLAGNLEAWEEMRTYNEMDVISMEELYHKLKPWDNSINFNTFHTAYHFQCSCGSIDFKKHGFVYTNSGKYQRYICKDCGSESRSKDNLLLKEKRQSLRK